MRAFVWAARKGGREKDHHSLRVIVSLIIFFALSMSIITFWVVDLRLRPTLIEWTTARVKQIVVTAVARAVSETVSGRIRHDDLIIWNERDPGILTANINHGEINRIVSQVTLRIQQLLDRVTSDKIPLPLGQILGSDIVAALGPELPVTIIPVGAVETSPYASFQSAGINQTWHRIYLKVGAEIRVVAPILVHTVKITTDIPIAEEIIVGKVPEVYLNWQQANGDKPLVIPMGPTETRMWKD